ncbi:MAG: tetratricopeptide repeat protein [Betaproteobacteria bacterium]|nr:tetratricopeptide repeat protein [Betaproteobacteria bacterium]
MSISSEFERAFRLHQQGKLREAFLRYDAVLAADPGNAPALHYSGVVLFQAGKLPEAAERIRASLKLEPRSPDAWSNLALVLDSAGRREAAVNALKEAAKLAPRSPEIYANLAASELGLGRAGEAEASARAAIAADSHYAAGWHNLALALQAQNRVLEALDAAGRAVGAAPAEPAYSGVKAQLEMAAGMMARARSTLDAALARTPRSAALRLELAGLLEREGDLAGAMNAYHDAMQLEPGNGAALSQLLFLRQRAADWCDLGDLRKRFRDGVAAGLPMLSPFVLLSQPSTRAEQRRCAETWSAALAPVVTAAAAEPVAAAPAPAASPARPLGSKRRLRLGYLSADFHTHATAYLAAGLFEAHDRGQFEVIAYSTGPDDRGTMRARLVRGFDRFIDVAGFAPERLADIIRRDGIDILIDLKGHTEGAAPAVLGLRPAPIQVHYLGYPGTLGGGLVDYLIGDAIVTPPQHAADYAETLALLPGSYQVNDRGRVVADPRSRDALGLPPQGVVLCCFNNSYKINPEVFDAWMQILAELPDAVLWLLARDTDADLTGNLRREAVRRGIDARRLAFAAPRPNPEYLALYRVADLFLDTWPYNAHTTASDALWAGCPVVTWRGETFAGRVAASLLTAVGLPELVCDDVEGYIATAIALARDPGERRRMRELLDGPGRQSPLFDTIATTRALEAAYLAMADQYRRGVREPIRVGLP